MQEQFTTTDGTLAGAINGANTAFSFSPAAAEATLYRNGVLMTQPFDGVASGTAVNLASINTPLSGDVITVRAQGPDTDTTLPPLNLPTQFTSLDGSITGMIDGNNVLFQLTALVPVTQVMLARNGVYLDRVPGDEDDYVWTCTQADIAGPWQTAITIADSQIPQSGDWLTAEVYFA